MTPSQEPLYPKQHVGQLEYLKTCRDCHRNLPISNFKKRGIMRSPACNDCRGDIVVLETITTKLCARCKIEKPVEQFPKASRYRHGLHSYCKECSRLSSQSYYDKQSKEKRISEYRAMDIEDRPKPRICANPRCHLSSVMQPPENFRRNGLYREGIFPICVDCESERRIELKNKHGDNTYNDDFMSKWREDRREVKTRLNKEWRDSHPEEEKIKRTKRRYSQYGVTRKWYEDTLAAQGGGCAICGSTDPKNIQNTFHIDHDHSCCTRKCHACDICRRGLLCNQCNTRLGHLENTIWVKQAKAYLAKHKLQDAFGDGHPSLFDGL